MKVKVTPELVERVLEIFKTAKKGIILTGQGGLTRQELRALEREGTIRKQPAKLKGSGSVRIAWQINPSFGNVDNQRGVVIKK